MLLESLNISYNKIAGRESVINAGDVRSLLSLDFRGNTLCQLPDYNMLCLKYLDFIETLDGVELRSRSQHCLNNLF